MTAAVIKKTDRRFFMPFFGQPQSGRKEFLYGIFFNSAVNVLQTLVIALGAGLGIWGVINLFGGLRKRQSGREKARA